MACLDIERRTRGLFIFYCDLQGLVYFSKRDILIVHNTTRVSRVMEKFAKNRIRSLVHEFIRCKKKICRDPACFLFAYLKNCDTFNERGNKVQPIVKSRQNLEVWFLISGFRHLNLQISMAY